MSSKAGPEQSLVHLARLRSALWQLNQDNQLKRTDYQRVLTQINEADRRHVARLEPRSLDQLIADSANTPDPLDLKPLVALQQDKQIRLWVARRTSARQAGEEALNVGALFPDDPDARFPLEPFDWSQPLKQLQQTLDTLKGSQEREALQDAARSLFQTPTATLFSRGAKPVPGHDLRSLLEKTQLTQAAHTFLWQALTKPKPLSSMDPAQLTPGELLETVEKSVDYLEQQNTRQHPAGGATVEENTHDARLLGWRGPGQALLIREWMRRQNWDGPARVRLSARWGLDPVHQSQELNRQVNAAIRQDLMGAAAYADAWCKACLPLQLLRLLAKVDDREQQDWVVAALNQWVAINQPVQTADTARETEAPNPTNNAEGEEAGDLQAEALDWEGDEVEDLDTLQPPVRQRDIEDTVVETTGTWNLYLRPFLTENWLGLIGAVSLTAAWMFLSMWLWEKGVTFRVLAGTIPIAVATLSAAWITGFLEKREVHGTSPRATALLASITFFMVPFYLQLSTGLTVAGEAGNLLGFGLGVAFMTTLSFIGRRIARPFGHPPRFYLYSASALSLLPGLTARWLPAWSEITLQALPIALSTVVFIALKRTERMAPEYFTYRWTIHVGHALLTTTLAMIFFRVPPEPAMLAVLLPLIAVALTYFHHDKPSRLIATGALSLLGCLFAFALSAPWLCFSLAVGGFAWYREACRKQRVVSREVAALHLFLAILVIGRALGIPWLQTALLMMPALWAVVAFERRLDQGPVILISSLLLLAPIPLTLLALQQDNRLFLTTVPATIGITWVWSHFRFQKYEQKAPWRLQHLIAPATLISLLFLQLGAGLQPRILPLLAALPAMIWLFINRLDRSSYTRQNTTLMRLLWLIPITVVAVQSTVITPLSFQPATFATLSGTLFTSTAVGFSVAKRTQSPLPAWTAFLVAALIVDWIRRGLGVDVYGGLPLALAAASAYGGAQWYRGRTESRQTQSPETSLLLPWRSAAWLVHTLLGTAAALALAATVRALSLSHLDLWSNVPQLTTLLLLTVLLYIATHRECAAKLAKAAHLYGLVFTVLLALHLREHWAWVILAVAAVFQGATLWVTRNPHRFEKTLQPALRPAATVIAYGTLLLGLIHILATWRASLGPALVYITLLGVFTHRARCRHTQPLLTHLTLGTAFLFWVRLITSSEFAALPLGISGPIPVSLLAAVGFATVIHLLRPLAYRKPTLCPARYRDALNGWRPIPATFAAGILVIQPFAMPEIQVPLWLGFLAWILLWDRYKIPADLEEHILYVRKGVHGTYQYLRALVLCALGVRLTGRLDTGLTLGLWFYAVSEQASRRLTKRFLPGTVPSDSPGEEQPNQAGDLVLQNLLPLVLGYHLCIWFTTPPNGIAPSTILLLYGLLPLVFATGFRLARKRLFALGLFWFAYANVFTALTFPPGFMPPLPAHQAVSAALVLTLTVFGCAARVAYREVTP